MLGFRGNTRSTGKRSTSAVFHNWANQTRTEQQSSHVRFEINTLFSYAAQIGQFYPDKAKNGQQIVLLSRRKYSPTTSGHQSAARSASSHHYQVFVDCWTNEYSHKWSEAKREILTEKLKEIFALCFNLPRKRNVTGAISIIQDEATLAYEFFRECFKWKEYPRSTPITLHVLERLNAGATAYLSKKNTGLADRIEAEKARTEKLAASKKRREAQKRAEDLVYLERWKNGDCLTGHFYNLPIALRVKDGTIETSRGATVAIPAALNLYYLIQHAPEQLKGFEINGFTVRDLVGTNGDRTLRVGCHDIPLSEIERIREELP